MVDRAPDGRMHSPAYRALRASSRRLLRFIAIETTRRGGGTVTLWADEFVVVGSIRVVLPGLAELKELGLIDWQRAPKRHIIGLSERWRDIATVEQAVKVSAAARTQRGPASQPASAST